MKNKYSQFFAILKKHGLEKEDVISEFTEGRTDSLKELTDGEYKELMIRLTKLNEPARKDFTPPPGDAQRKKIIAIARNMRWTKPHPNPFYRGKVVADMERIDNWCLKQKFKKRLNDHTEPELGVLVTIFDKVERTFLKGLQR